MSDTSSAPLGGHPRRGETVRVKGGLYAGRIGTVVQVQGEGRWRDSGYRVVEFVGQDGKPFVEEFAPDRLEPAGGGSAATRVPRVPDADRGSAASDAGRGGEDA